jgi:hypothetical protein
MASERIIRTDQEQADDPSTVQHLASAERELSAFVAAVNELFDAWQARQAAANWIEELARADWPSEATVMDWRRVTIAAAARFVGRDKRRLSTN